MLKVKEEELRNSRGRYEKERGELVGRVERMRKYEIQAKAF